MGSWEEVKEGVWQRDSTGCTLTLRRKQGAWEWRATVWLAEQWVELAGRRPPKAKERERVSAAEMQKAAELGLSGCLVQLREDADEMVAKLLEGNLAQRGADVDGPLFTKNTG
jgi:hypothetical protein